MNRFFLSFLSFVLLFLIESCSCGRDKSVYDKYQESDKECGKLNAPCCFLKTCEDGLVCDAKTNICTEKEDEKAEECDDGKDEEGNKEDNDNDEDNSDEDNSDEDQPGYSGGGGGGGGGGTNTEPENDEDSDDESPCISNPCLETENSSGYCTVVDKQEYVCDCEENYSWNWWDRICEPDSLYGVKCIGLPDHAKWNTKSSINQEWNGSEWVPSEIGTYNEEPSSKECRYKCKENYTWDGSVCNADSRTTECTGLPDHAVWNTVSTIVQIWNEYSWDPASTAKYNEDPSDTECRFKCDPGFFYDSNIKKCVDPCKCDIPYSTGVCEATNAHAYLCECEDDYFFNTSTKSCDLKTKYDVPCKGLPENAEWNTVDHITQTWNGNEWFPSQNGSFSETSSETECVFKCKADYHWNDFNKCIYNKRTVDCSGLPPAKAHWNSIDKVEQTWDEYEWIPSEIGRYNPVPSDTECRFDCDENYFWDGTSCLENPCGCPEGLSSCESKICATHNATGLCISKAANKFVCECNPGFYWWNNSVCIDKKPLHLGNICTGQKKCYDGENETVCPGSPEADFFGQDAQYAELGTCTPQSFSISEKIVYDNNTGLEWQRNLTFAQNITWEKANEYCRNLAYNGYTGWRLPTPQELLTIVDSGRHPAVDGTYFPDLNWHELPFWTSKDLKSYSENAFGGDFFYGKIDYFPKTRGMYKTICVWGDEMPAASLSTETVGEDENAVEVVIDSTTGLMWQKSYETEITWKESLSYCETLTYGGYDDWRLPNKNELASLLNYDMYDHLTEFPETPNKYFWSSTTGTNSFETAYGVYFPKGTVSKSSKSMSLIPVARCVR